MEIVDRPMDTNEMCEVLRIRKNTLHSKRWRRGVGIPTFRFGKHLLARREDFWKWYKQRMVLDNEAVSGR